jgi:external thioesterase TEII
MKKDQLFLLHFAGGSCYSFQFIASLLSEFDVISLELPGRGKRMNELLLTDFEKAANDIYNQINKKLNSSKFIIYGHSMGAYLALRVARMLEEANRSPAYLIVSGNPGPGIRQDNAKIRHMLERDEFIEELRLLNGVPPELLENRELFNFFEPILRADFEVAEKNQLATEPPVNIPIYAMMGSKEQKVDEISNWLRFTKSNFKFEILKGDHFFIYNHPHRIASIIKDCYSRIAL